MSETQKLLNLLGEFVGNTNLCTYHVRKREIENKTRRRLWKVGLKLAQIPAEMRVLISQGLVNTKGFDWQKDTWGSKGKVTDFRLLKWFQFRSKTWAQKSILCNCRIMRGKRELYLVGSGLGKLK